MSMDHGILELKNYMINNLIMLLSEPLAGQAARARNRFITGLTDLTKRLEAERITILKKHADLSEAGELQTDTDGQYKFKKPEDKTAFQAEFEAFIKEPATLLCRAEQYVDFKTVKQILDTSARTMDVKETAVYEEIMTAFENWEKSTV